MQNNCSTLYVVYSTDEESTCVVKIFATEEEAKRYIDIYNELNQDYYEYYYRQEQISTFDLNTTLTKYYGYFADVEWIPAEKLRSFYWVSEDDKLYKTDMELENLYNHPDKNRIQDNELYIKIDKGEHFVDISYDKDGHPVFIESYSKNSFGEAKQIGLDLWKKEIKNLKTRIGLK